MGAASRVRGGAVAIVSSVVDTARDLTVLTNSIETFQAFQGKPGVTPLLTAASSSPAPAAWSGRWPPAWPRTSC